MVFKVSWLPYILILGGILLVAEGQGAAAILIVVGVAWLVLKHRNKKRQAAQEAAAQEVPTASPVYSQPVQQVPQPVQQESAAKFCTQCGTKAAEGSAFCSNCGNKL